MKFGTKAENLNAVYNQLDKAKTLPVFYFTVEEWTQERKRVLNNIAALKWINEPVVVRSSAQAEDGAISSNAGKFDSVLNVFGFEEIEQAIQKVIGSYTSNFLKDQVFLQPMVNGCKMSGVAFTIDPNNGGNYYVINYDCNSATTDSVTSGHGNFLTFYKFKGYFDLTSHLDMDKIIAMAQELEQLFENDALDIEFCQNQKGEFVLLQVRPLVLQCRRQSLEKQKIALDRAHSYLSQAMNPKPYLHGQNTIYSNMQDWNPAEMIGVRPKPLALSLYKDLITDGTWAYQRDGYGYKDLRSFPLIIDLEGFPYIDSRVSFNSFLPKGLTKETAEKLVSYYIQTLKKNPSKHDKVEFEIIFSCYAFDLPERIKLLYQHGFSEEECNEILQQLNSLTKKIINAEDGLWKIDNKKIEELKHRQDIIMENAQMDSVEKLYWVLSDCRRWGTLPFAGLARAAFIAIQLLRSMITLDVFSKDDYNAYLNSLNMVASEMQQDLSKMNKGTFLEKYGHLRPGTYDITSQRYDEIPEKYFSWEKIFDSNTIDDYMDGTYKISLKQLHEMKILLQKYGLSEDVLALFDFLKGAIEGREFSKFVFTRSVSCALCLIEDIGKQYGFTRDELSYLQINDLLSLYASTKDHKKALMKSIEQGKLRHEETLGLSLPPIITEPINCYFFTTGIEIPNYITLKSITAETATVNDKDLSGKILLISSADPGYDWIFSHNIAGLITKYGGVNSHMAIRAGELAIPAIIGAGETLYMHLQQAKSIRIDCSLQKIMVLR